VRDELSRRAAEAFQSGQDLFAVLAAHTPVGIFVSHPEKGAIYVNERWCELTGLTPEQAMGEGWRVALHPDDAARVNAEWAEAGAEGRDSVVEYRFLRPGGSVSWIEGYAATVRDDAGRVIGWVGTCLDFTARKQAEIELARAAERFRAAFDNAPIGIALAMPNGRWLEGNPAFCQLLGYSEEELRELTIFDVTHPDDRADTAERRRRQIAGEEPPARIEKRYLRSDGGLVWVAVTSTMVRDLAGEPLYSVAQIEDITEHKKAQRALAEAEERFHRAFDHAPIGMALVTPDGRWLQVNPAFCELLGYEPDELTTLTFMDVTHPDDLEASLEHSRRQLDGEVDSLRIEKRYVRKNGAVVWVALSSTLTRNADGTPQHFVAQIEDVTDRVVAQRSLEEAEERFRRAFEDAPIGMAIVALDGRWLRVNQSLCDLTGYPERDLLKMTFWEITHPDDLDQNRDDIEDLIAGRSRFMRTEKRYIRPNGRTVWVHVSSSLVEDADGNPVHLVSQIEDVTDRKRAETKLRDLAEHDSLTGLLNRRRFDEELDEALVRLRRRRGAAALLLLDLDHFKLVNDTHGHKTGDDVLVAVASVLRKRLRAADVIGRIGGDEFAVLLDSADAEAAAAMGRELVESLHELRVPAGHAEVRVTASIGIVVLDAELADEAAALIAADRALYRAKNDGRDRVALG
jgi:diguanylate cyclase (GGDEF)-like protein/PAS domain S-box-containing protein